MKKLLIIVEQNDGKYLKIRKILKELCLETAEIQIIYSTESDIKNINKKNKNNIINSININDIILDTNLIKEIDNDSINYVNKFFMEIENDVAYYENMKNFYGVFIDTVYFSLNIKEKLKKVKESFNYDYAYLIGKRKSVFYGETQLLFFNKLKYNETISAWTNFIYNNNASNFFMICTDNILNKSIKNILGLFFFIFGFIIKGNSYSIIKSNMTTQKNNLILLRSKTHIKYATNFFNDKQFSNTIIFDRKRIKESDLKILYIDKQILAHNFKIIDISKILKSFLEYFINNKKFINIKEITKKYTFNYNLFIVSFIITKIIKLRIEKQIGKGRFNCYYTFEESNLFGSIFSNSIVPVVNFSACIQHGFFVSISRTLPLTSNERWIWGKYFLNKYIEVGEDKERLKINGRKILNIEENCEISTLNGFNVLIAPSWYNNGELLLDWIMNVYNYIKNIKVENVIVTLHPSQSFKIEISNFIKMKIPNVEVIFGITYDKIRNSNLVFTGNTTVGFEAALLSKNVVAYLSNKEEVIYDYLKHPYIFNLVDKKWEDFLEEDEWKLRREQYNNFLSEYAN